MTKFTRALSSQASLAASSSFVSQHGPALGLVGTLLAAGIGACAFIYHTLNTSEAKLAAINLALVNEQKASELKVAAMGQKMAEVEGALKEQIARLEGSVSKGLLDYITHGDYERLRAAVAIPPLEVRSAGAGANAGGGDGIGGGGSGTK